LAQQKHLQKCTCLCTLSLAWSKPHEFASSFDWIVSFLYAWLARVITFIGFGFISLHSKYSITYCLINIINYIMFGAKFEKHYFKISRDILYSAFYDFSCKHYDIITNLHNTKMSVSVKWKKIFQSEKRHCYYFFLESLSNINKQKLFFIS